MDKSEFDIWLDEHMSKPTPRGEGEVKVKPGPSIYELINTERLFAAGQYRIGLDQGLYVIDQANFDGEKPYFALVAALERAKNVVKDPEYIRGVETAFFIFKNPYKWIAGERI